MQTTVYIIAIIVAQLVLLAELVLLFIWDGTFDYHRTEKMP
jgi:hypothetical protein